MTEIIGQNGSSGRTIASTHEAPVDATIASKDVLGAVVNVPQPKPIGGSKPVGGSRPPSTGSRFIESGLTNSGADGQAPPSNSAASTGNGHDNLSAVSNNVICSPLNMSELGAQDQSTSGQGTIRSAIFLIPFPAPINANRSSNTPPFLLYSPPRSVYLKPAQNEDGKRGKEKFIKKLVRLWQEEVQMGEEIKRQEITNPSRFKKIRGSCIRVASKINKWLPSSCIETLARLPPRHKLGKVTIIHPMFSQSEEMYFEGTDSPYEPTEDELHNDMGVLLRKTRQRILFRAILSGMLLPISLAIDVFAPVFSFEINITYFSYQLYGLHKAKTLLHGPRQKKAKRVKRSKKSKRDSTFEEANLLVDNVPAGVPSDPVAPAEGIYEFTTAGCPVFDPVLILLYKICAKLDPVSFPALTPETETPGPTLPEEHYSDQSSIVPPLPPSLKRPGGEVVREMVKVFRETLPEETVARYVLDEERLAEDLARYLKKASKEYIDSLSGRSDRKGLLFRFKSWRKKSAAKSQAKKEKEKAMKIQAKEEKVEVKKRKKLDKKQAAELKAQVKAEAAEAGEADEARAGIQAVLTAATSTAQTSGEMAPTADPLV